MNSLGSVIAIVGPTASGKSALADEVARRLQSSVVSVDAMQVYRGMDIGTAKMPPEERSVPLLMIDIAEVDCDYSVQLFQRDARHVVKTLLDAYKVPILCGGTGLYLNAVIDDMRFPSGERGDDRRTRYEQMADEMGATKLHELLQEREPASAALIHPNNVRRVVRALEMHDEGVSYAKHHEGLHQRAPYFDAHIWGIACERSVLYDRIERRVDQMYDQGLIEEARILRHRGLGSTGTAGQAIGYQEALAVLDGTMGESEARKRTKVRTRHYAKRQLSWFGRDSRVQWLSVDELGLEAAATRIIDDFQRSTKSD